MLLKKKLYLKVLPGYKDLMAFNTVKILTKIALFKSDTGINLSYKKIVI